LKRLRMVSIRSSRNHKQVDCVHIAGLPIHKVAGTDMSCFVGGFTKVESDLIRSCRAKLTVQRI
jgi:hypothetical protein